MDLQDYLKGEWQNIYLELCTVSPVELHREATVKNFGN
jgi:hypothetical protein